MKNLLFTLLCICCGTMLFAQNPICDANIWPSNYENGVTTLTAADSSGTSVETYLWSTGETTPTIDVTTEGEYCVTITYAGGCSASTCYNLLFNECWSNATWWATNTGFQVNAYGAPYYLDATYEWSNGATTSSFFTTVPGTYCVTITRENGCTSTSCVNVNAPQNNLGVQVLYGDSISNPIFAQVFLILYDSIQGTLTATQSQATNINGTGSTLFSGIPAGQYLVKAAIIPGTVGFNDYLPTYSYSSLLWSDAQFVTVYPNSGNGAVVYLIPGNNPGGQGFIGGFVSEGANFTDHHTEAESGEGDPVANAGIVITLLDGTAVAATTTNASGEYSFPGLAYGTYVVTIDIPGVPPVSTTITLSPNQPGFSGINFNVTQNGATLSASDVAFEAFAKVAPNPVHDMLQVTLKDAEGELWISNLQGQVLRQMSVNASQMQVSLANLPNGVYLLTARTAKGSQSTRIVKQ